LTPALIEHVHGRDLDVAVVTDSPDGRGLPASLDCTHLLDEQAPFRGRPRSAGLGC